MRLESDSPSSNDVRPVLILCSCTSANAPADDADTWRTAQEMGRALSQKYPVEYLSGDDPDVFAELNKLKKESGVVVNMMERSRDVHWPAVLEKLGLAYSGCDAFTFMLSTNKPWMKIFAEQSGMRIARGITLGDSLPSDVPLTFPVIIKPSAEDASVGIRQENFCRSLPELKSRLESIRAGHPGPWLIEEYIAGTDATVPLFAENGEAQILPFLEIRFDKLPGGAIPILSYEAKWHEDNPIFGGHSEECPAKLPEESITKILSDISKLVRLLNLTGYARIDFRLDETRQPWFLELNANPRLSEKDCYFVKAAMAEGIGYFEIMERIVSMGRHRNIK